MVEGWDDVMQVFARASELSGAAREEYLARACEGRGQVRAEVESLLRAMAQSPVRTGAGLAAAGAAIGRGNVAGQGPANGENGPPEERAGGRIGPYRLVEQIGEGGFGSVFMAAQEEPVRRKVALKVIKWGMDSRSVVARFEQERQALALMDHPHIARVLDAGATAGGRPYFVMELVNGVPITHYADRNTLTVHERLGLFVQVCQAVQHAHTKGVMHRDLKPSNILVSTQDGRPHAKVIDFGVAKATAQRMTDKTLFTEHRAMLGTPEYMSPEQADGSLDLDTRTDVYSLGVVLYELLTGTTPFDREELRSAPYADLQRIIREVDPPKPSTRLSSQAKLAETAAMRRTEPRRLGAVVRGDLDWIVMRALEKDRGRRYDTPAGLAEDVQRHLAGETVSAAPPSAGYRLRKLARRHRAGVAAGIVVALALLTGTGVAFAGLVWALQAKGAETTAKVEAQRQRAGAERTASFMTTMLSGVSPWVALGRDTSVLKELLDDAAARVERGDLKNAPETEATLRLTIGQMYRQLGAHEAAGAMLATAEALARALDPSAERLVARVMAERAGLLDDLRRWPEAEALLLRTLDVQAAIAPGDDPDTAAMLTSLGVVLERQSRRAEAQLVLDRSLAMSERLGLGDDARMVSLLSTLGTVRHRLGRSAEAEAIYTRALEMAQRLHRGDHPQVAIVLNNVGAFERELGRLGRAEPLMRRGLEMRERLYPGDSAELARALHNLGVVCQERGQLGEAESLFGRALEMRRRLFPGDHPAVIGTLASLGGVRIVRGRPDEAEPLLAEATAMVERLPRTDDLDIAEALNSIGYARERQDRSAEAEPLFRRALEIRERTLGRDDPHVLRSLINLAAALQDLGRVKEAEAMHRRALESSERLYPQGHPLVAGALHNIASILVGQERAAEAEPLARRAVAMLSLLYAGSHPDALRARSLLCIALYKLGRWAELDVVAAESVEMARALYGGDHLDVANMLTNLGFARREQGRAREAEGPFREAMEIRERILGPRHAVVATARANLAVVIEVQERWAEAEPLRRAILEGVRAQGGKDPNALGGLGINLMRQGRWAQAEPLLRECVELRSRTPADDPGVWRRYAAMSALGEAVLGQAATAPERLEEAGALVMAGWEGLKDDPRVPVTAVPDRKREALERVVRLEEALEAAGKVAAVAEWRARLGEYDAKKTGR